MRGRRGDNPPRRRRRLQKRGEGNKKDKISLFSLLFPFVLRESGRRRAHGVQRMLVLWVLRAALRRRDQGREDQSGLCPVCVPLLLCFSPQLHFLLRADRRRHYSTFPPILFPPTPIKHFGILSRCPFPPLPQRSILIVLPDTTFAFFPPLDPGREGGGERKEGKEKRKLVVRAKGGQAVSRNEIRAGGEGGRRVFHAKAKKGVKQNKERYGGKLRVGQPHGLREGY